MGCCCSKRSRRNSGSAFGGEGRRLGTADEQNRDARAARAAAAEKRSLKDHGHDPEPYIDDQITDDDRARIREERLAATEGRLTKQEKKAMNQKKKTSSDAPLRGPNTKNTMTWTSG